MTFAAHPKLLSHIFPHLWLGFGRDLQAHPVELELPTATITHFSRHLAIHQFVSEEVAVPQEPSLQALRR